MAQKKSSAGLFITLSVMMFFVFFTWGAWFVTVGAFMFEHGMSEWIGFAYSTTPIAAIVTPFFMGVFADRFMNAERLQGILMILSGVLMALAPRFASAESPKLFVGILLLHSLSFMPVLGLSNTICLKHLTDSEKDYPKVRVFATLGWIVAGWIVSGFLKADTSVLQFYVAAAAAVGVGIFSFFMPKTPPPSKGAQFAFADIYGGATFPYFKIPSFAVFMFASLLACVAMMPYWANGATFLSHSGIERPGRFLTFGQIAELFVLALILPFFIKKFGIKWTMIIGMGCWIARYILFSAAAASLSGAGLEVGQLAKEAIPQGVPALLLGGVILHGFAYDFVFVSGYLYVDKHVREEVRAQAQGLLTVFTQGIGFLLSSQIIAGIFFNRIVGENAAFDEWQKFWILPVAYLVVILILFVLLFRERGGEHIEDQD